MNENYVYRPIDIIVVGGKELTDAIDRYLDLGYAVEAKPRVYKSMLGYYSTEYKLTIYKEEESND